MKELKSQKLKIAIVVLMILLVINIIGGIFIFKRLSFSKMLTENDNVITPYHEDSTCSSLRDKLNSEGSNNLDSYNFPNQTGSINEIKTSGFVLNDKQSEYKTELRVTNMFPGDQKMKWYFINVSYKNDIVIHYQANIRPGYEKLAEVLKVRIQNLEADEIVYDGLMRDMPLSFNHSLYTDKDRHSDLCYGIMTYLDTSVGNEYQNQELIADFHWWVEES